MEKGSSFTVRDLPRPERPRERLQKFGPEALSAQELLALVIGRGIPKKSVMNIAQELLAKIWQCQSNKPGNHRGTLSNKGDRSCQSSPN